jgi:hypothetical protein
MHCVSAIINRIRTLTKTGVTGHWQRTCDDTFSLVSLVSAGLNIGIAPEWTLELPNRLGGLPSQYAKAVQLSRKAGHQVSFRVVVYPLAGAQTTARCRNPPEDDMRCACDDGL